ncbi:hypothetical protein J4526_07910 [Desulfurococcaceae archaeon MEX13E-LK6-19]|nr:hypothetical protein J4526_07910 [Desulfurococcaceae archaeon MEX13E-LK6-19]
MVLPKNLLRWVSARELDMINMLLEKHDIEASRHAYSYRLLYKGKIIASIHLYPGFEEASIRLYKYSRDEASEVKDVIVGVVKKVFPNYKISVKWYPP